MRLWIGVHLPLLPVETFRPRWSEPGLHAVIDREHVLSMTPETAQAGVRVGMRRGGVAAMAAGVTLHERDLAREQAALDSIAMALLQYTPEVALAEEASLLLDVTASLRAFGGRLNLCRLVRASIAGLGFTAQISMAPRAQGAWLLARFNPPTLSRLTGLPSGRRTRQRQRRVVSMESMVRRIDALPCLLLPAARAYQDWLLGIACRSMGDLRNLPRPGLQRRCGQALLAGLDLVYGNATELFDWVCPPPTFSARLELPDRIEHAEALLFAVRRLIVQMTGWLAARQLAISHFSLLLEHERGRQAIAPTPLIIKLGEPAWREEHLVRLLKERLARFQLCAPVMAIRVEVAQVSPMAPLSESLFPEPGGTAADYRRLLELLTARLGDEGVLMPAPQADHRPERANAWTPAGVPHRKTAASGQLQGQIRPQGQKLRPFWLLAHPIVLSVHNERPYYGSPLRLVSGPERIECGWWDGAAVRDYFVAQGAQSARYWIYRERNGADAGWFLHGLFG